MLTVFKYVGELLTKIVVYGQGVSINGFRPFGYLIGLSLLAIFGAFIRGLLFSGVGGSAYKSVSSSLIKKRISPNQD